MKKILCGLALALLMLTACQSGPRRLTRSWDDWVNQKYTENAWVHGALLQDILPVYPIVGFFAAIFVAACSIRLRFRCIRASQAVNALSRSSRLRSVATTPLVTRRRTSSPHWFIAKLAGVHTRRVLFSV